MYSVDSGTEKLVVSAEKTGVGVDDGRTGAGAEDPVAEVAF